MESAEIWEQYEGHLLRKLDSSRSALELQIFTENGWRSRFRERLI